MQQKPLNAVTVLIFKTSIAHLFDQSCVPSDTCQQIVGMAEGQFCILEMVLLCVYGTFSSHWFLSRFETIYCRSEFLLFQINMPLPTSQLVYVSYKTWKYDFAWSFTCLQLVIQKFSTLLQGHTGDHWQPWEMQHRCCSLFVAG